MLRRAFPTTATKVAAALTCSVRTAYHKPTKHDWSNIFEHQLSEKEKEMVQAQMRRTVSAVVPGEMFIRHWIVAEQSTVSILNRVLSGMIVVFTMLWAAGYATLGYNGHNNAHVAGWMFIAYWLVMHTHMLWLAPTFLGAAFLELALN